MLGAGLMLGPVAVSLKTPAQVERDSGCHNSDGHNRYDSAAPWSSADPTRVGPASPAHSIGIGAAVRHRCYPLLLAASTPRVTRRLAAVSAAALLNIESPDLTIHNAELHRSTEGDRQRPAYQLGDIPRFHR